MTQEILNKVGEISEAVKVMREANDANLKKYDGLLVEKTDKINDDVNKLAEELDKLQKFANRRPLSKDLKGEDIEISEAEVEHKKAWDVWLRKGSDETGLAERQKKSPYTKAMTVGDDTAGGFFVPRVIDNQVINVLRNLSPMRQICRVINVTTPDYIQFVNKHGATSGWVGEAEARPETNTPVFGGIRPAMGELYAMPKASQQMLDDASFDVESFLAGELAEQFAIDEGTAFLTGSGINRPIGLLPATSATMTADASLTFGTIGGIKTGTNGAFPTQSSTVSPADVFYNAVGELKVAYRQGMQWMFNRKTETKVRTFKDGQGNFMWSMNNLQAGWQASVVGIPYVLNEDMPDYTTTGANAILLGNFSKAYTIVDRFGIRTLRDPYTSKPYVLFYSTKRVGGMITDTFAVKAIQFAA